MNFMELMSKHTDAWCVDYSGEVGSSVSIHTPVELSSTAKEEIERFIAYNAGPTEVKFKVGTIK